MASGCTDRGIPHNGHRCNPAKLLLDPYAKAVEGQVQWNEAVFPYHFGDPDNSKNDDDSAPYVPRSVVANPYFDWANDRAPKTPSHSSVIFEAHVKGLTARHPDIPPGAARHLCGPGVSGGDRLPDGARVSPPSS